MGTGGKIVLRGVEVHNLKEIDLDIPHRKLVVICGVSGSGKSSLALDTLYAEGQRRYIESFSAYSRQFLEQFEKPEAECIDGIPPAIAVTGSITTKSSRTTVGTATETYDYLRLLYSKIGRTYCVSCGELIQCDTSESVAQFLETLPPKTRFFLTWKISVPKDIHSSLEMLTSLKESGFIRVILGETLYDLSHISPQDLPPMKTIMEAEYFYVVVDRLQAGMSGQRIRDSVEMAFSRGDGKCVIFIEETEHPSEKIFENTPEEPAHEHFKIIDNRRWLVRHFSMKLSCEHCHVDYPTPEPRLFSFNSPLGACTMCEGFGNTIDMDMDLIVPDTSKTLRDGAIAPWNSPAYRHELEKVLKYGPKNGLPVDIPFKELTEDALEVLMNGVPGTEFMGLNGFFAWMERRKYKMHIRVFLSRWRSFRPCPMCNGRRLQPLALAITIGKRWNEVLPDPEKKPRFEPKNIAELNEMKVDDLVLFLHQLQKEFTEWEKQVGTPILQQVLSRLQFLQTTGLGYLTLERTLRTLSGGESRRVSLAAALGASLVNMLYVLDEPSIGLHPSDSRKLLTAIEALKNRDNSVVVVEHDETIIRAADQIIEIGPGAGERGGEVIFQGTPEEMIASSHSLTGQYLSGERGYCSTQRRSTDSGWIRLNGARGNNLKNLSVSFPLGCLCLVTGVSGSGKSTLVEKTLYPALSKRLRKEVGKPYDYDEILGDGQIDDVIMVDQSPIGRSPRSNPVTYLKAFDEIRAVFAETREAKKRGYTAANFSFNSEEGRCPACNGDGLVEIDMQFLADVYMKCSTCRGTRYKKEILDITYRNRNIAEVLEMTVREAFTFFRGSHGVQNRLKRLIEVGLDYIRLGQPANTLSGGEAQRLKLAAYMSNTKRGRSLFILDEPSTGLHFSDVVQLLDCFETLLSIGHSLIVVEHNVQMMRAADYIIDLGPGAADQGGLIVAQGTPEEICKCPDSITGKYLSEALRGNPFSSDSL
ncbi:MAG: excinuclease ABC subunit UvrA [Planctomycetia bacterium]|nr:excinuclease ABC subunit UvrA [Planctomycetia bacterium]